MTLSELKKFVRQLQKDKAAKIDLDGGIGFSFSKIVITSDNDSVILEKYQNNLGFYEPKVTINDSDVQVDNEGDLIDYITNFFR